MRRVHLAGFALSGLAVLALTSLASAMCGYFSRPIINDVKQPPVLQPSQIAFITWDPTEKVETVSVQPRFEGNAIDFGMVINQDVNALGRIQRGLHQPGFTHLTLSGEECRIVNLHRNLEQMLGIEPSEITGG